MPDDVEPVVRGIQNRFRDLSVDVREERIIRFIVKQLRQGRAFDDVMADPYIVSHTTETTRARLLQHPSVLKGIEVEIRAQFADYRSVAHHAAGTPEAD
ncbi:MAG TPA: hypothetical protein VIL51_04365 [Thermoleophilia bacterium]|jgi:hypothetical protein